MCARKSGIPTVIKFAARDYLSVFVDLFSMLTSHYLSGIGGFIFQVPPWWRIGNPVKIRNGPAAVIPALEWCTQFKRALSTSRVTAVSVGRPLKGMESQKTCLKTYQDAPRGQGRLMRGNNRESPGHYDPGTFFMAKRTH
jgi:hypothetical protein